jgi:mannitol/fructose-specific phosphotransferase system IIA component (Ntr-type)
MSTTLVELFPESVILPDLQAQDKKEAIREIVRHLVTIERLPADAEKKAERAITKRETQGSTGIGKGLAIPHAKGCGFLDEIIGVFARSRTGLPFDSVDGGLVHVVFLVLSPKAAQDNHTQLMKRIAKLLWDEKTLNYLARDDELKSIYDIFKEVDESVG